MEHVLLGEASKTEISETNLNILLEQNDTRGYITREHMWLCFLDVAFFHSYMRSDYRAISPVPQDKQKSLITPWKRWNWFGVELQISI